MEAALRNPEEFSCFLEVLRLSKDYDRLHAWMWLRVIDDLRITKAKDEAAIHRQIRHLWNTYLSEKGEKAVAVEVDRIFEWGPHIQEQVSLIEALLYADLQRCWVEYKKSGARKKLLGRPLSEVILRRKRKSVSPKLGRRASESKLLHTSIEIRTEFFKLGTLMRVE
jgi:hypothetical protein